MWVEIQLFPRLKAENQPSILFTRVGNDGTLVASTLNLPLSIFFNQLQSEETGPLSANFR
jgi:hypothetical protein